MNIGLFFFLFFFSLLLLYFSFAFFKTRTASSVKLGAKYPGWVLVTGASTGLGRAFVSKLAGEEFEGLILTATSKSKPQLEEFAKTILSNNNNNNNNNKFQIRIITANLAKKDEVTSLLEQINDVRVSLLINNAGFGLNGRIDKLEIEQLLNMVSLNCSAVLQITHAIVKKHSTFIGQHQQIKPSLVVINISSLAGTVVSIPWQEVYSATKAFVTSLSHGLAYSLRSQGVKIVLVEPGTIHDTQFQLNSGQPFHRGHNTTDSVSNLVIQNLKQNATTFDHYHLITSFHDRIIAFASKLLPNSFILSRAGKRGKAYSPEHLR